MRWKIPAGTALALAMLAPAAPAMAQAPAPAPLTGPVKVPLTGPVKVPFTCASPQYADLRAFTADLDTASDTDVRVRAGQLLTVANAEHLTTLPGKIQQELGATPEELRAFLRTAWQAYWATDLRVAISQTLNNAGTREHAAGMSALAVADIDGYLAYLNDGRYVARGQDHGTYKAYADLRTRITVDLDTASDDDVRVQAAQILTEANAEHLTTLPGRIQQELGATPDELRAFLKGGYEQPWTVDLRIAVVQTLSGAGHYVSAAAQTTLDGSGLDTDLAYLDHGLYYARAQDCV